NLSVWSRLTGRRARGRTRPTRAAAYSLRWTTHTAKRSRLSFRGAGTLRVSLRSLPRWPTSNISLRGSRSGSRKTKPSMARHIATFAPADGDDAEPCFHFPLSGRRIRAGGDGGAKRRTPGNHDDEYLRPRNYDRRRRRLHRPDSGPGRNCR